MQSRNKFKRIVCIALAVIMTLSLVSTALILMVHAASSKEIEKELVDLRAQQAELKKQSDALKAEINQNEAETKIRRKRRRSLKRRRTSTSRWTCPARQLKTSTRRFSSTAC